MVVSKMDDKAECALKISNQLIKQVESFKYLGSVIQNDGRCETEIRVRIAIAKDAFYKMETLFKSHIVSLNTKLCLLNTYIYPLLLYGSECWTISTTMHKRLEAAEM